MPSFSDLQKYQGPRCEVCLLPVYPAPGQIVRYHGSCRPLRTKRGMKRFERWLARSMRKNKGFRKLLNLEQRTLPPAALKGLDE